MTEQTDIVERLREVASFGGTHLDGLWTEAAAEIARLRAENEALREDAERGRFIVENWHSTVGLVRLPQWVSYNALRLGGVRAAIDAAMKDHP